MFRLRFLIPALLLVLSLAPAAQAEPAFFQNYVYGMPKAEIAKISGIEEGRDEMAGELHLPGQVWLQMPWTVRFRFEDEKLVEVQLFAPYTRTAFNALREQMTKENSELLGIVLDDKALDLFQLINAGGVDAFRTRLSQLLREKTPGRMSYQYFSMDKVPREVRERATNINQFLGMVESDIRETEIILTGDGKGSKPLYLSVSFTFPVLDVFRNPPEELRGRL